MEPNRRTAAFGSSAVSENYERRLAPLLFAPWAEILIEAVGVRPGDRVLDVASGTGVVARLAARHAGPEGHVVASDVSAAMLGFAATVVDRSAAGAPIEFLEASVTELPVEDGSFDVVLCQQGLPFFTDRPAAAAEMRRVLRPGGRVGASVWTSGRRLEPFEEYIEALAATGVEPPFPAAFASETYKMAPGDVRELLERAGFDSVEVRTIEHEQVWDDARSAAEGILGTPFAPLLDSLSAADRDSLESELVRRFEPSLPGQPVRRTSSAVVARAVAPTS